MIHTSRFLWSYLIPLATTSALLACDGTNNEASDDESSDSSAESSSTKVTATLTASSVIPNPAPKVKGSGTLKSDSSDKVTLMLEVSDCPAGDHGFHIHEGTKCGSDGSDAKAHWDPAEVGQDDPEHAGNVGKVKCNEDGEGTLEFSHPEWSLEEDSKFNPNGLSVVLHGLDAKQRIACGLIEGSADELKFELEAMDLSANPAADIEGEFNISTTSDGVSMKASFENCPEGDHGFHIHKESECGEDGKAAGPHWDPTELGLDDPEHLGNLGTVKCDAEGKGSFSLDSDSITLEEGETTNPLGLAVVLHGIDPANRIACGVIE